MNRYRQINTVLSIERPKSILEVGTWNGYRAIEMMTAAKAEAYYGFDLFETGTRELDKIEFNAKPRRPLSAVANLLQGRFFFALFPGNSKETLPEFLKDYGENSVDFAYIDGGHSVETIESDWQNVSRIVKPNGLILFDDYYTDGPDVEKVGCNKTVEHLIHEIFPVTDPVVGGGKVQLVSVRNIK